MSDIGLPNIMMTQALPPQSQPTAELSSRRTGSKTLKREDSSPETGAAPGRAAFRDLVDEASPRKESEASSDVTDKRSGATSESLSESDRNSAKRIAAGDDSLKPISIDRSRRDDDADSQTNESPSALDVKGEKSKKSEKPQAPESKKTKALKDFMSQMQQHFGIKPEEILQAFAKLSPQELMQSPQEVSAQILKNLNLTEDQKPLAGLIYQQMVAQTTDIKTQPLASSNLPLQNPKNIATGFVDQGSALEIEKAGERAGERAGEGAKSDLMSKLQSLKDAKPATADADSKVGAEAALSADMNKAKEQLTDLQKLALELKKLGGDDKSKEVEGLQQKLQAAMSGALAAKAAPAAGQAAQATAKDSSDIEARLSALSQMMGQAAAANGKATGKADGAQGQLGANLAQNTDAAASSMATLTALMSKFSGGENNSSGQQSGQGQKDMKAFDALQGSTKADSKADAGDVFAALTQTGSQAANASHTGATANAQPGAPIAAGDLAQTINDIISKSQVLVKKGGGEMKIEMKSESMGPVNLKVAVTNGQVSVSMTTQNDKAKKALEDNMHELKAALTTHKLDVGDIKVGLSEGAHKHQDHTANDQQAREQARESASQFLGNMHDEREQNRGGFFDQPAFHAYSQNPASRAKVGPAGEVAVSALNKMNQTRSFGRAGNSGRLSMVA